MLNSNLINEPAPSNYFLIQTSLERYINSYVYLMMVTALVLYSISMLCHKRCSKIRPIWDCQSTIH